MIPQNPGKYNKFSVNILRKYIVGTAHAFLSKLLPPLCKRRGRSASPSKYLKPPLWKGRWHGVSRVGGIVFLQFYSALIRRRCLVQSPTRYRGMPPLHKGAFLFICCAIFPCTREVTQRKPHQTFALSKGSWRGKSSPHLSLPCAKGGGTA